MTETFDQAGMEFDAAVGFDGGNATGQGSDGPTPWDPRDVLLGRIERGGRAGRVGLA